MSPLQLNNLLKELKTRVPGIGATWMVVDDSQLTKNLGERTSEENTFLVGALPNYGTTGDHADAVRETVRGFLLIVDKTDYSELPYEDFVSSFETTYQKAKAVKEAMLAMVSEGCNPALRNLDVNSLQMEPEWKNAQCNGWNLSFDIL